MPSDHDVVACDGCLEPIRWAITVNGRRQAVNADPTPRGTSPRTETAPAR